ncbi:MBL fold metallo-hydrolase [Pseudoalteromonas piscicida]|uniref:Ribonuclease Z n=2 Tax=Pseudoalteromonas piscicida TaxID=43662 RepID=A0AAD0RN91_PSEO7|nr:MBL fold metallo-hydrolase [Pseudoalteromonas piscicida]AXR04436.1 MBL fold metallo-hydrolase [Pseudoalteromonas piscicida]
MSAAAVSFENTKAWVLIDCAEATQHALLHSELTLYHLEAICITHLHGDHCYGLPGLVSSMALNSRKAPLKLIAPRAVIQFVQSCFTLTEVRLSFDLITIALEEINAKLQLECCDIDIIALQHRVPSVGYKLTEKCIPRKLKIDKLQQDGIASGGHYNLLQKGQDVEYQGRLLTSDDYSFYSWQPRVAIVCGDNEKPGLLSQMIKGVDLLVHEATFTAADLHKVGFHTGHSDAKRIAQFAQLHQVPMLALTHFSVRYHGEGMLQPLIEEAKLHFSNALIIAEDGLIVDMPKQKQVEYATA